MGWTGTSPLQMAERTSDPAAIANNGQLYVKEVSAKAELFYEDDLGNVTQITSSGAINAGELGGSPTFTTVGIGAAVAAAEVLSITASKTIASGASAVWNGIYVAAATATISGSTNITTATGFNLATVMAPLLTSGSAVVVTYAATLRIEGAPTVGGSTTLTAPYALWVDGGETRLDGKLAVYNSISGTTPDSEFLQFAWLSNNATIGTKKSGTGTVRTLQILYNDSASSAINFGSAVSGGLTVNPTSSNIAVNGGASFGGGGARTVTSGTNIEVQINPSFLDSGTNSSTISEALKINPTINYTGVTRTGNVKLLYLNPTNTSLPTGLSAAISLSSTATALGGIILHNVTSETDYEIMQIYSDSNVFAIKSVKGGSGTLRGLRFGATGNSISFYGATPVALQTGVAVTAAGVHAALVNLGLITA